MFGENFPYTNFHDLNMDWIIKIAKDFLDQYTHIQEIIEQGKTDIQNLTEEGLESIQTLTTEELEALQNKYEALSELLQSWYNTHSEDIANQLASALSDLNDWYTVHENYLNETLATNLATFNTLAELKAQETIASIPSDYTDLSNEVQATVEAMNDQMDTILVIKNIYNPNDADVVRDYSIASDGSLVPNQGLYTTGYLPVEYGKTYYIRQGYSANAPLYDSSKTVIGSRFIDGTHPLVVNDVDIKYFRMSGNIDSINSDYICENIQHSFYQYYPVGKSYKYNNERRYTTITLHSLLTEIKKQWANKVVVNVLDPSKCISGLGIYNSNGYIYGNTDLYLTDFIPCSYGDTFKCRDGYTAVNANFYDEDHNFIGTTQFNTTLTISNASAKYFRMSGLAENINTDMIIFNDSYYPTIYHNFGIHLINSFDTYPELVKFFNKYVSLNHENPSTSTDHWQIQLDGTENANNDFYTTDYILVSEGDRVYINPAYNTVLFAYDTNKTYIAPIYNNGTRNQFDVPAGVSCIRLVGETGNISTDMVFLNHPYPEVFYPYNEVVFNNKPWTGKTAITIGDSIVLNKRYVEGVGLVDQVGFQAYMKELGFSNIVNAGVSGACIAEAGSQYVDIVTTAQNTDFSTYDLVLVSGGTNDFYPFQTTIGALSTSGNYDISTVAGALQTIIEKILTDNPDCKICLLTPLKRFDYPWYNTNNKNKTLKDYRDIIVQIAEYYSIPVLDYFNVGGFNSMSVSALTYDSLHPDNKGYKFICKNKLVSFIASL